MTVFRPAGGAWERADFLLRQKHHPHEHVVADLTAAGFDQVASFDGADDLGMKGTIGKYRTFYLARKKGSRQ